MHSKMRARGPEDGKWRRPSLRVPGLLAGGGSPFWVEFRCRLTKPQPCLTAGLDYLLPVMLQGIANWTRRCASNLLAAGLLPSGYGAAPAEEGFGEIVATSFLGGFIGLIGGLLVTHVLRYISFVTGRNLGGHTWTVLGALVGTIAFAVLALTTGED
jgi:hypothetical protein